MGMFRVRRTMPVLEVVVTDGQRVGMETRKPFIIMKLKLSVVVRRTHFQNWKLTDWANL